ASGAGSEDHGLRSPVTSTGERKPICVACCGPAHLRTYRNSANLLRSHRPKYPPAHAARQHVRLLLRWLDPLTLGGLASPASLYPAAARRARRLDLPPLVTLGP